MKKSILLLFAAFATLAASAHDFEVNGIYYNITSSTTAEVTYKGSSSDEYSYEYSGSINLPATVTYEGVDYSVTSIGNSTFRNCTSLTAITIPESVTSTGIYAFGDCSSLTAITIPENSQLTSIGNYAFSSCSSLSTINIPEGVTSIGECAFSNCSSLTAINIPENVTSIETATFSDCSRLTSITIPEGVTSIGISAFSNCSRLTSITLPEGVTSIGDYAFCECSKLTSITLPEGVTSIGNSAFSGCNNLTTITLPKGVTSIGDYAFYYCTRLESITLPEGVTSIGNDTFHYCSNLTNITIPDNSQLTSIGDYAFDSCSSLTTINIPEGVTSIGYSAFYYCISLTAIVVAEGNKVYDSRGGCNAIIETSSNTLILGCAKTIIPEGVTSIGSTAFSECRNLTTINIPKSVTSIGNYSFDSCSNLTTITIPDNSQLTSIGSNAFEDCSSLTSITIPKDVTSIGNYAFEDCSNLKTVINYSGLNFRRGSTGNGYVAYYADKVVNDVDGVIDGYVFETKDGVPHLAVYIGNDTELTLPKDYKGKSYQIGYAAFYKSSSLTAITIPESVTSIGYAAFSGCSSLSTIIVEEGNKVYDSRNGCNAIIETNSNTLIHGCSTTNIPEGVTSIGERAFEGSSIKTITIPEGVTSIGKYAFYSSSLISITIPESMTSIGYRPFIDCRSLTTVHISNLEAWCKISFEDQYSNPCSIAQKFHLNKKLVTDLVIPEGVTSIGNYAFYNMCDLTSITIPESVTSIGEGAFLNCSYPYSSITCKAITPPSASSSTFSGVYELIPVYVPSGSVEAYKAADGWKNFYYIIGTDFTGIDNTELEDQNSAIIYDLHGRRVENPTKDGIYIVNGKKVVIK